MKILAIGIYQFQNLDHGLTFKKIASAQLNQINFYNVFGKDFLTKFENETAHELEEALIHENNVSYFMTSDENHYCTKLLGTDYVVVIVSRNRIELLELNFLFNNIKHAFLRPEKAKTKLQDIIDNPLAFINHDCYISTLQKNLNETKSDLIIACDKIVMRGEKLSLLKNDTIDLKESCKELNEEAKKLRSCCYFL